MTHVQVLLRDPKSHNKRDLEGFRHVVSKKEGRERRGLVWSLCSCTTKSFHSSASVHFSFCSDVPSKWPDGVRSSLDVQMTVLKCCFHGSYEPDEPSPELRKKKFATQTCIYIIVLLQREHSQVHKLQHLPRPSLTNIELSVAVQSLHTGDL